MTVFIFSRSQLMAILEKMSFDRCAIISFADTDKDFLEFPIEANVLKISFYDVRPHQVRKKDYGSLLPEAKEIAAFIQKNISEGKDIICQCEYGISRSSGCAAAIMEHYEQKGISVFSDYRYTPNLFVYHKVLMGLNQFNEKITSFHPQ